MKLTKGMKKALSVLMSAAMVVTGVNVTTASADAAEGDGVSFKFIITPGNWTDLDKNVTISDVGPIDVEFADITQTTGIANLGYFSKEEGQDNAPQIEVTIDTIVVNSSYEMTLLKKKTEVLDPADGNKNGVMDVWTDSIQNKDEATVVAETADKKASIKSEYVNTTTDNGNQYDNYMMKLCVDGQEGAQEITGLTYKFVVTKYGDKVYTPGGSEDPAPAESNDPAPAESNDPAPAESNDPAPAESNDPAPAESNDPAPAESNDPAPVESNDPAPVESGDPAPEETGSPAPNPNKPVAAADKYDGSMEKFSVFMNYVSDEQWGDQGWDVNESVVDKDGEYTVEYTAMSDTEDVFMVILSTNLKNGSTPKDFKLVATKAIAGEKEITLDDKTGYWRFADDELDKAFRYNIKNPWNGLVGDDITAGDVTEESSCDAFKGEKVALKAGEKLVITFKVTGMDKDAEKVTYEKKPEATAPAPTATVATTPTNSAVTPPAATATAITGTKKITPKKKSVIVAAGKSTTVKFTASVAAPATQTAVIEATSAKKGIATAKVSGKSVKISVPKKATKGASTQITLKSKDAAGKTVSAKIKVTVQNKVKKVTTKSKSITIKKGKKKTVTLNVTAQNKKKATTDTVKVSSKVVKLAKSVVKKGKVTVTLKGKKKGSQKVTIKVGSKSVKVKVKVN